MGTKRTESLNCIEGDRVEYVVTEERLREEMNGVDEYAYIEEPPTPRRRIWRAWRWITRPFRRAFGRGITTEISVELEGDTRFRMIRLKLASPTAYKLSVDGYSLLEYKD